MKLLPKLTGLSLLAPLSAYCQPEQPNIIFFLVDDYGWLDSSVAYGEEVYPNNLRIQTPNMERLSKMGVVMTNAYACPLSTPTRTSLMTGMNSAHERVTTFTSPEKDSPTDCSGGSHGFYASLDDLNKDSLFLRPDWNYNGISPVKGGDHTLYATPMVQHLKDAGYFTIHVGKAHWASMGTPAASPLNMGFVVNIAGNMAGMPRSYYAEENFGNIPDKWNYSAINDLEEFYGTDIDLTQALTQKALAALDFPIRTHQPFYLYLSHYGVHTPIQANKNYYQKYIDAGLEEKTACYASMVESVDESLGHVLDFIEQRGIADNTIIIFYSDNGGHSVNKAKGGKAHRFNAPLREGKASVYEGGIRVPLMFYWPGKSAAGTRVNTPVVPEDFYPTILSMAGIQEYHTGQTLDGKNLCDLIVKGSQLARKAMDDGTITNQKQANAFVVPESVSGINPERPVIFHMPHRWRVEEQADVDFMSAIREGEWKLVYRMRTGALELYNLPTDISERNDVATAHPDIVKRLASDLGLQLRAWDAPMPIYRATGKPAPMPDKLK
jgi:arylsulfatase A-like enzyme